MKREKIFYTAAIVLLVAALIGCLYYKRPLDIKELTGVTDPDDIAISVILTDGDMDLQQRDLTLSAGDEGFDELLTQLEAIQFRRPPTNLVRIALPFLPELGESSKEGGWGLPAPVHLPEPARRGRRAGLRLCGVLGGQSGSTGTLTGLSPCPWLWRTARATGQDLCAQIWDKATPVESNS